MSDDLRERIVDAVSFCAAVLTDDDAYEIADAALRVLNLRRECGFRWSDPTFPGMESVADSAEGIPEDWPTVRVTRYVTDWKATMSENPKSFCPCGCGVTYMHVKECRCGSCSSASGNHKRARVELCAKCTHDEADHRSRWHRRG